MTELANTLAAITWKIGSIPVVRGMIPPLPTKKKKCVHNMTPEPIGVILFGKKRIFANVIRDLKMIMEEEGARI